MEEDFCSLSNIDKEKLLEDFKKFAAENGLDPSMLEQAMEYADSILIQPEADPLINTLSARPFRMEALLSALRSGADPNIPKVGRYGKPTLPVKVAVELGNFLAVKALIQHGAKVNVSELIGNDSTLLLSAVSSENAYRPEIHLKLLQVLLEAGADPNEITSYRESPLTHAWRCRAYEAVDLLIAFGADESRLAMTPLLWAVHRGDSIKFKELLAAGVDLTQRDLLGESALEKAIRLRRTKMIESLVKKVGDLEAKEKESIAEAAILSDDQAILDWATKSGYLLLTEDNGADKLLKTAAQNKCAHSTAWLLENIQEEWSQSALDKALDSAEDCKTATLLIKAGADLSNLDDEVRASVTGWGSQDFPDFSRVSQSDFQRAKNPRFGCSNPEEADEPYWQAMIKSRSWASLGAEHFLPELTFDHQVPHWSARRFGQTMTFLPDGRIIEIAGEHEDSYDPDFNIYNDVIVHVPGESIKVFLYPDSVFPPTDFHTATLVGDFIYIIGCLGYQNQRANQVITPVYRLDLHTLAIEKVETSGEMPGWISRHQAFLCDESEIRVSGGATIQGTSFKGLVGSYFLNLQTLKWKKVEES